MARLLLKHFTIANWWASEVQLGKSVSALSTPSEYVLVRNISFFNKPNLSEPASKQFLIYLPKISGVG
ncbi:uncharacterized protein Dmoj_GI25624, isoform B [Drosophila mojavensis]|uniref:Uncharacterized protein, isoform B n=1 Tax=Drosophila mojavensis TaxID=7230 RepID=A0A0Q9WXM8_DROMO|nr:uncharacterized protein Dmoj_GI25624, isoform B [Drosophila mojavensis]